MHKWGFGGADGDSSLPGCYIMYNFEFW